MTQDSSELQISASPAADSMTTQITTKFGPTSVSYSPAGIELGITTIVHEILQAPVESRTISGDFNISVSIRKSAETYYEHERRKFPMDAIEQFSETARGYSRGTVEQFIDNLPAAIGLMMDCLAIAALTLGGTNERAASNSTPKEKRQALLSILRDQIVC